MPEEHDDQIEQATSLPDALPAEAVDVAAFVHQTSATISDIARSREAAQGLSSFNNEIAKAAAAANEAMNSRTWEDINSRFNLSKSILDDQQAALTSLLDSQKFDAQAFVSTYDNQPASIVSKIDPAMLKPFVSDGERARAKREVQQLDVLQGMLTAVQQSAQVSADALTEAKAASAEAATTKRINWAVLAVAAATLIVAVVAIFVTIALAP
jgi:hypothetical protein